MLDDMFDELQVRDGKSYPSLKELLKRLKNKLAYEGDQYL
jgi:hypothetical protein